MSLAAARAAERVMATRRRRPRPEKLLAPEIPVAPVTKTVYYVFQRKYGLDRGAVWWRRLAFQVYLRIARFFYMKPFRIPMVDGRDSTGAEFYIEHQGVYLDEVLARQASDRALWGFHKLPLDDSLPAHTTVATHHEMPGSSANGQYRRNGKPTVELPRLDLVKLAGQIAKTDSLVENFHHSKAT